MSGYEQEGEKPFISQIRFSADHSNQCDFIGTHFHEVHAPICEFFTYSIKNVAFILLYVALWDYGRIHQAFSMYLSGGF